MHRHVCMMTGLNLVREHALVYLMTTTETVATMMGGQVQEAQKLLQPVKKDARGCSKELQARPEEPLHLVLDFYTS